MMTQNRNDDFYFLQLSLRIRYQMGAFCSPYFRCNKIIQKKKMLCKKLILLYNSDSRGKSQRIQRPTMAHKTLKNMFATH